MADITSEEVLKIVLAVLGLSILFILGFSLYKIFVQQTELEQAKEHLDNIASIVENLKVGENGQYLLTGPKDWFVVDYDSNKEFTYGDKKGKLLVPSSCKSGNCICFCNKGSNVAKTFIEAFGPDDYQEYLDNYFYSEYFYQETNGLTINSAGFNQCEKKSVCRDLGNVTISYRTSFDAGSRIFFGIKITTNVTASMSLPWIPINQTKDLKFTKYNDNKVMITS